MVNKRLIILISLILAVIIVAAFSLWFLFKSPETTTPDTEKERVEEIISEPITPSKESELNIFQISNTAVVSPVISGNKILYHSKEDGIAYETDFEGKSTKSLTNISVPNIITAVWSYDRSKAVNIYEENGEIKKASFDFTTQKAFGLNSGIKFINSSPNKDRIVYQFIDEKLNINKISTADFNDTNWQTVFNIRMNNIRIYWPSENLITISTAPSGLIKGSALMKKLDDPQSGLTKLIGEAYGLTIKYSLDGSKLIFSQTDQYGHNPSIYLIKDGVSENLNIPTISDKCSFSEKNNIYCAVPDVINGSLILPDDFYKNIANFSDTFKKVDTNNNRTSTIFNPKDFNQNFNASDILISPNEDYLIFINKNDGLLYSIKIK